MDQKEYKNQLVPNNTKDAVLIKNGNTITAYRLILVVQKMLESKRMTNEFIQVLSIYLMDMSSITELFVHATRGI